MFPSVPYEVPIGFNPKSSLEVAKLMLGACLQAAFAMPHPPVT